MRIVVFLFVFNRQISFLLAMQRQQTVSEALSANEVRKYSSLQLFQLLTALWGSSSYWGLFCSALLKGIFLGSILAVACYKALRRGPFSPFLPYLHLCFSFFCNLRADSDRTREWF